MKKKLDYPIGFYIARFINIFCLLAFNLLMYVGAGYIASYFLLLFYFWLLIVLSFIELKYVVNGDKSLFKEYKKTNFFFLFFYILSIVSILYHYLS